LWSVGGGIRGVLAGALIGSLVSRRMLEAVHHVA